MAARALSLVLAFTLAGCSSMPSPPDLLNKPAPGDYVSLASHNKLVDHPSAAVSAPASVGLGLGTIIGLPIMIVALPITLPLGISAFTDNPKVSNLDILGNAVAWPDAVCAIGGAYAFGEIPYLIVGDAPKARTGQRAVMPASDPPPSSK